MRSHLSQFHSPPRQTRSLRSWKAFKTLAVATLLKMFMEDSRSVVFYFDDGLFSRKMIHLVSSIYNQSRWGRQVIEDCSSNWRFQTSWGFPWWTQGQLYPIPKNKFFSTFFFLIRAVSHISTLPNLFLFQAALDLKWSHPNKVLIHIADAPAHGPLFHTRCK